MISGRIDDKQFWVTCPTAIQQMLELLSDPAIEQKGEGRHEVNGDMFYVLMHYDSAPLEQVPPETHKKYIDVQFVRRGQESMLWAPLRKEESKQNGEPGSQISVPYNPEKDVQYYQLPSPYTLLPCPAGSVNVFFRMIFTRPA